MRKYFIALVALAGTMASVTVVIAPAEAQVRRGHVFTAQGPNGRGIVKSRTVARDIGYRTVDRRVQTSGGQGYNSSRNAAWGPGHYSRSVSNQANNGRGYTSSRNSNGGPGHYSGSRDVQTTTVVAITRHATPIGAMVIIPAAAPRLPETVRLSVAARP